MIQFLIWAVGAYVLIVIANMVLVIPIGAIAESQWAERKREAGDKNLLTSVVLRSQTLFTFTYGLGAGAILALVLLFLTLNYVSEHLLYQLTLLLFFILASVHNLRKYVRSSRGEA